MKTLLVIDGNAVLHRAFHAMPEWRNRSGEATSGVYGFFSMLLKAREDLNPDYLVVTFDMPEPNFRHAMYVGYQSNRGRDEQLDRDIWEQVEKLKVALEKLGVPVFAVAGYEADDVIGTVALQATSSKSQIPNPKSQKVDEVIILTGDRDLLQLVDDRVKVYMPIKGLSETVLLDRDGVKAKMGVWPEQIVDYKALVGDGSDGYPGVAGVGPKGACQLISQFENLDRLYGEITSSKPQIPARNATHSVAGGPNPKSQIKDNLKAKLLEGYEMARMSQKLATIICDVPLTLDLGKAVMPSKEKFAQLFEEVRHPSLKARVMGEEFKTQNSKLKSERQNSKVSENQELLF